MPLDLVKVYVLMVRTEIPRYHKKFQKTLLKTRNLVTAENRLQKEALTKAFEMNQSKSHFNHFSISLRNIHTMLQLSVAQ